MMNNKIIIKPAEGTASYEATKTNEEIIKHKNVLVKKYDSLNGRPFEDFLKSAIASCILIEKYQGYFVRNIFKAASAFRSSFNKNERRFLLCLSDNLHNVPELAELFIETVRMLEDCESEDEITELIKRTKENFLLRLVTERLQKTVEIIRNKEERKSLKIKDNNHILSWCYELNALSSSCEGLYTQLEEFIQTGQENKKIYRKQIIKEKNMIDNSIKIGSSKYNPITVTFSNGRKKLSLAIPYPEINLAILDSYSRYVGADRIDGIGENLDVNYTVTRGKPETETSGYCEQFVMIINNSLLQELLKENFEEIELSE